MSDRAVPPEDAVWTVTGQSWHRPGPKEGRTRCGRTEWTRGPRPPMGSAADRLRAPVRCTLCYGTERS